MTCAAFRGAMVIGSIQYWDDTITGVSAASVVDGGHHPGPAEPPT